MRKIFILISLILLSFTFISCKHNNKQSDEDLLREIFKIEQEIKSNTNIDDKLLNHYDEISKDKSKIVSRIKDSVDWANKLNRDADYYDLKYLLDLEYQGSSFSINLINHLNLTRYNISFEERYIYDIDYAKQILNVFSSIPYVKIEYEKWPYVIESIHKEYLFSNFCSCKEYPNYYIGFLVEMIIYDNGYVHLLTRAATDNNTPTGHFISLIPLDDNYKDIISDSKLEDYAQEMILK